MKRAEAAAQVAKSNRDDASPKGESNPLEGTSLGHFRLVLVGLPTRWKSATRVRESSGLHPHAQMGAVPASSPLSSTTAAETAAGRLGRRTSAPPVLTVLRPESTVQAHQPTANYPSFCEVRTLSTADYRLFYEFGKLRHNASNDICAFNGLLRVLSCIYEM